VPDELRLHLGGTGAPLGSPAAIKRGLIVASAIVLLCALVRLMIGDQLLGQIAVFIAGMSAIAVLMLSYTRLLLANGGLFLADGRAGVVGALGGRKGVEVRDVDHLQKCSIQNWSTARPFPVVLFVDRSGRSILRLDSADALPDDGLAEFSRRSGLALEGSWDEPVAPKELARRFPGSVPRATLISYSVLEHPRRTGWIVGGTTVLVFLGLFVALLVRSNR
jgi:hypothetical protein